MQPAQQRITRSDDFTTVLRNGTRAGRDTLVVHLLVPDMTSREPGARPSEHAAESADGPARFGLVVPKQVGTAVVRNRVARRLRHLMRPLLDELPAGTLVVIRARPPAAAAGPELGTDLERALARARAKADRAAGALVHA